MNNACKGAFRRVDKPMTPSIVQIVTSPLARASKTPAQNCENRRGPSGPNAGPLRRSKGISKRPRPEQARRALEREGIDNAMLERAGAYFQRVREAEEQKQGDDA